MAFLKDLVLKVQSMSSTLADHQTSRGNSRDLPAYACRLYVTAFRVSIGLW